MRILFVCYHNPYFETMTECIERAILKQGHQLVSYDYRSWKIPGRIRDRINILHKWELQSINDGLYAAALKFDPELLLVNGAYTIAAGTIEKIKKRFPHCKTVNWISDFPLKFEEYCETGPFYDHFLTSGTEALERYKLLGNSNGGWLPFACDPDIHRPAKLNKEESRRYGCDICFIGGNYTERVEILRELTGFDLGIWGIRWEKLPEDSPLKRNIRGGMVDVLEWSKIYSASKISLNIIGHRCDIFRPFIPEQDFRMTNTKVFEILSCGGFQLVDAKADVLSLFEDRKHLVVYHNTKELKELIAYYLSHPDETAKIKQEGMAYVRQHHTYRDRINEIISIVQSKPRIAQHDTTRLIVNQGAKQKSPAGKQLTGNILFSGYHNPHFPTVTEYIENALRTQGNNLAIFDPRKRIFPGRLHQAAPSFARLDQWISTAKLLSKVRSSRPRAAVFSGGFGIHLNALRAIAKRGITTVLWTTDAPNESFYQLIEAAPFYNHIFCQGTEAVELFAQAGITRARWLPMACDPAHHCRGEVSPHEAEDAGREVVFVGSYYPNRWELLKQLDGFPLGIYGPQWNVTRHEWPPGFTVKDVFLQPMEWMKLYCTAKIVIISHFHDPKFLCYQASPKVFEALAANCFVLVDRQKDVFSLFSDNEHLVGFDDAEDLKKKITYYLAHEEERKQIAQNGHRYTIENHTYVHRVKTLMPYL